MRRPDRVTAGGDVGDKPERGSILLEYPHLYEYLTESSWDDGKPRDRATIMIIADGGRFKLWLNDKALGRSCWVSGETLEAAFLSLDAGLSADDLEWRKAPQNAGKWSKKNA